MSKMGNYVVGLQEAIDEAIEDGCTTVEEIQAYLKDIGFYNEKSFIEAYIAEVQPFDFFEGE